MRDPNGKLHQGTFAQKPETIAELLASWDKLYPGVSMQLLRPIGGRAAEILTTMPLMFDRPHQKCTIKLYRVCRETRFVVKIA